MEITACKNRDKTGKSIEVRNDEHGDGSSGAEEENGRMLFSGRKDFSGNDQIKMQKMQAPARKTPLPQ
jgi:hypothetical protein